MNESPLSVDGVPPHPRHNRKEISHFLILMAVIAGAWYALSRIPRYETASLYVLGLGPLVGLFCFSLFRKVRCPQCQKAMRLARTGTIAGKEWGVFRCGNCHGEWRVEQSKSAGD